MASFDDYLREGRLQEDYIRASILEKQEFFKSALELPQIKTAESVEVEVSKEELRIAITTGAVSVGKERM